MVKILFFRKGKYIKGFEISGHSNFYKKPVNRILLKLGIKHKDYICSAISSMAYMTVIGIKEILRKEIEFKEEESGYMKCILKSEPDKESNNLLRTFELSLKHIENEYPGNIQISWR